jgi:SAM-dependent methyltransferase
MRRVYPAGLQGRSVLDCACNCGGYLFWAKELGAGRCFGFDARQHWIDQALFLLAHRDAANEDMDFRVCDLYDLPKLQTQPFDITIFHGIFYHLPDPIAGLKIAADLTQELLLLNTATRNDLPDGLLVMEEEDPGIMVSGIHGLTWRPTGPAVLTRLLKWLGFAETHCVFWHDEMANQAPGWGRLQLIAARTTGLLDRFSDVVEESAPLPSSRTSDRDANVVAPRQAPPMIGSVLR